MCIICHLYNKEILTRGEAKRACFELVDTVDADDAHLKELYAKLEDEERAEKNESDKTGSN